VFKKAKEIVIYWQEVVTGCECVGIKRKLWGGSFVPE